MVYLGFIVVWTIVCPLPARAFYLQQSIEFSQPNHSPYPYVLSQPINILPQGFVTINVGDDTFYYCNGVFYQRIMRDQKYVIVPPPIGAVVFNIPQGYELMFMDGLTYYEYQGVYYKRTLAGYKVIYPPV